MINSLYFDYYKDNYNIYNLITKINKDYRLVFNKKENNFCIINIAKNNQICLKFNSFLFNIIKTLLETRVENSQKIFNEIENFNNNLEFKNQNKLNNDLKDRVDNLFKFSKRVNSISSSEINQIIKGKND